MKTVPVTQGKVALVDDEDFDRVASMGKWQAHYLKGTWYACITKRINGKKTNFLMHRVILRLKPGETRDHKDRDGLNNQKNNFRRATQSQQQANRRIGKNNTSGFKGVGFHKKTGKWQVSVRHTYVGLFETKEEARRVYNEVAKAVFGEFAMLNPEGDSDLPDDALPDEIRQSDWETMGDDDEIDDEE